MDGELRVAIGEGDLPRVKLLLQGGASNAETRTHGSALSWAKVKGKPLIVEWLLAEGEAIISDVDHVTRLEASRMRDELEEAICESDLPKVKLLVHGGASIAETRTQLSALDQAAATGEALIVEWVLAEGGANISDVDSNEGFTALLSAAYDTRRLNDNVKTIQWLLEDGGADITDMTPHGETVWDLLQNTVFAGFVCSWKKGVAAGELTALLRVMVLQSAPPADLVVQMSLQHSLVVEEGARLRAELPAFLARRRALLAEHTLLIAPLRALVSSYEEPTMTQELWATGLGDLAPWYAGGQAVDARCLWALINE